ncbi:hypothetical protein MPTK1_6g13310 [Marchantia polymorpha subsp. ruderalis]|uniref:Uncharacterized protein n=2 Tax=Marchantia polymorpha TaxID=3197 RepID=A0A176VJ92_MARPO|nr:hypothetical protein AXG93_4698s1340 [Marchantia polymorpha subsp. ruderalis]PTQ37066.1 hypothetical protein MARPO_0059s0018 [Marchantia polymorpha]BBN14653.1 hypothetical protein Mp_6g13310 [Marchantia polymorpha subsp. ruderalis]|eukprot:PTQ37066.1 hypothetical protein MARPO_0059s0018 [Marchantia polymorpha]
MAQLLSLERGRQSALLLLLLVLLSLHLTAAAALRLPPSGNLSNRQSQVVQSPLEQNEVDELAFLDKLPQPLKEAIQAELKECMAFPQATYARCVYDRRALIAYTEDYSSPGSNPNPVVGSPAIG